MNNLEIEQMVADGFAIKRISQISNKGEEEIKRLIKENNWEITKEEFSEDKKEKIIQLYQDGVSAKSLGMKFNIDKRRIQKWADEKNVLRNRADSHRFTDFNQHVFDAIDTAEKAYWLGFFYADAYNCDLTNTFTVALKDEDYSHLEKLSQFVNLPSSKITRYLSKIKGEDGSKEYPTCALRLYSKHLCQTMTSLGCPRAKSFIIQYPDWLNKSFDRHFIRGMFDGDGSLVHRTNGEWKWSLVTTRECGEKIQRIILKELDLIVNLNSISKTGNNTYELESNGNEKVLKLAGWLYQNSSPGTRLDRKYSRMLELKKLQGEEEDEQLVNIADPQQEEVMITKLQEERSKSQFEKIAVINGKAITTKYVKTLSKEERFDLIEPLFEHFRTMGWQYPDNLSKIQKSWKKLVEHKPDLSKMDLFNNDSMATDICKYFCHKFYDATENGYPTMKEIYQDDDKLRKLIQNRLGLDWKDPDNDETFNLCFRMLIQGMRSSRVVPSISIFKPSIAKYLYMKYSNEGDVVFDYSCGWGGRMLGAASCGRKYIGTDPWTTDELEVMKSALKLKDVTLINNGSEHVKLEENSIDFSFSSPPYYDQEVYSKDLNQAYNQGEDYFYNVYWRQTLENVKFMLKPEKWFGLNVKNYPRMLSMAEDLFGPVVEEVNLRTIRSHLNKGAGVSKNESIYMFKNNK